MRYQGTNKWRGEMVFIGEAFAGELVGIAEPDTGDHIVRFCGHDVGVIGRSSDRCRNLPRKAGALRARVEPDQFFDLRNVASDRRRIDEIFIAEHRLCFHTIEMPGSAIPLHSPQGSWMAGIRIEGGGLTMVREY